MTTTNEVKTRLATYLLDEERDFDSLRASLLPVLQEANNHGDEFETLVGSVGYLLARFGSGLMTEPDFLEGLRLLSEEATGGAMALVSKKDNLIEKENQAIAQQMALREPSLTLELSSAYASYSLDPGSYGWARTSYLSGNYASYLLFPPQTDAFVQMEMTPRVVVPTELLFDEPKPQDSYEVRLRR
jgi:hypothetical protein